MTWQTWMIILAFALSKPIAVFAFCEPLTLKYKKAHIMWLFVLGCALFTYIRAWFFINIPAIPDGLLYMLVMLIYLFVFFRFICNDKILKIALITLLIYALGILGHILAAVVFYSIFGEAIVFDFVGNKSMYIGFITVFFEILFYSLFFFIWRRFIGKIRSDIPNVWAFLLVIGGQLIYSFTHLLDMVLRPVEVNPWMVVGIIIMAIGNLAILQILLTNSKKAELEENLSKIQHLRELEQLHYSAIETRRQEMTKIRHDFRNQLTAAHQLIITNKGEHAEKLLDELEKSLDDTKEYLFCQNAIVNAVLTEKQKDCDSAGIELEAEIALDENYNISPMHLCSIFTNLLDNAIRACNALAKEQRKIEIRTAVRGEYLHIKCVNPVADFTEKERHGKGYGKIILSDIASHYGGNFTAEKSDNTYVAMMSILYTA